MERAIKFELTIHAPAREVWSVLTDAEHIPSWWEGVHAVKVTDPKPGGVYVLDYQSGEPDKCEILQSDAGKLLRFRWTSSEPEPTLVEYRLEAIEGGTRLTMVNSGYKQGGKWARAYDANFVGWVKMLLGVRRLLEDAHERSDSK